MLSKKRPILFDVMGNRGRATRVQPVRETPVPRRPKAAAPRRERRSPSELMATPAVRWAALSLVVVAAVSFAIWRMQRPAAPQAPKLQTTAGEDEKPAADRSDETQRPAAHAFAICALEKPYSTPAARKLAAEQVQEIVDFLGYHSDPAFRDVRGQDCPGKESGTGAFRIYVGSADRKSKLFSLRDKLLPLSWKRTRPFQNATIRLVER
jgi:hypothetical protein